MSALEIVLAVKITLTIVLWAVPLLFFPAKWISAIGFPVPDPSVNAKNPPVASPIVFLRLLGMAFLSLALVYAFGLRVAFRGEYPASTVWIGILSNGGSFAILLMAAFKSSWKFWGLPAQVAMWFFLVAVGLIAAGLIAFGPLSDFPN